MAWLIMNDIADYVVEHYPTHILGKSNKLIPVFIGATSVIGSKENFIGIYVKDKEYSNIDHTKVYVLIHDPDIEQENVNEMIDNLDSSELERLEKVSDSNSADRVHIHVWPTPRDSESDRKPNC